jgi:hypothetical protein
MMIADATIMATSFGFADGDIVRRGTCAGSANLAQNRLAWTGGYSVATLDFRPTGVERNRKSAPSWLPALLKSY